MDAPAVVVENIVDRFIVGRDESVEPDSCAEQAGGHGLWSSCGREYADVFNAIVFCGGSFCVVESYAACFSVFDEILIYLYASGVHDADSFWSEVCDAVVVDFCILCQEYVYSEVVVDDVAVLYLDLAMIVGG